MQCWGLYETLWSGRAALGRHIARPGDRPVERTPAWRFNGANHQPFVVANLILYSKWLNCHLVFMLTRVGLPYFLALETPGHQELH